jgi:hypothetical protein
MRRIAQLPRVRCSRPNPVSGFALGDERDAVALDLELGE